MEFLKSFNTVNGKCCCNNSVTNIVIDTRITSFNTVNGKCCCNFTEKTPTKRESSVEFQYRKR